VVILPLIILHPDVLGERGRVGEGEGGGGSPGPSEIMAGIGTGPFDVNDNILPKNSI